MLKSVSPYIGKYKKYKDCQIVESGSHEELMAKGGEYSIMVSKQSA